MYPNKSLSYISKCSNKSPLWKKVRVWTASLKDLLPYLVWQAGIFCAERYETADVLRVLVKAKVLEQMVAIGFSFVSFWLWLQPY